MKRLHPRHPILQPRTRLAAAALAASILIIPSAQTQPAAALQSAAELLQGVETRAAQAQPKEEKPSSPSEAFQSDLKSFQTAVATLEPAQAARQWLELTDRYFDLADSPADFGRPMSFRSMNRLDAATLVQALPPPAAWPELSRQVANLAPATGAKGSWNLGQRLLTAALDGDKDALKRVLADLAQRYNEADAMERLQWGHILESLNDIVLTLSGDTEARLKSLEQRLNLLAKAPPDADPSLDLPDLVALFGAAKAESLLRQALVLPRVEMSIESGYNTRQLARRLAIELMEKIATPPWHLVDSIDAVDLYEAIQKRFPGSQDQAVDTDELTGLPIRLNSRHFSPDYSQQQAKVYYLLGLIVRQRTEEAVQTARSLRGGGFGGELPMEAVKALERAGHTQALADFFHALLSQFPELPYWQDYFQLAAKSGQTDRMLALTRAAAARPELSPIQRAQIQNHLASALLAADQVDEGVAQLRLLLAQPDRPRGRYDNEDSKTALGLRLARIGHLLERNDWLDEGLQHARTGLRESPPADPGQFDATTTLGLARVLADSGRGAEAQAALSEALVTVAKSKETADRSWYGVSPGQSLLQSLAYLYHAAGRPQDVLALLDQAPYWDAADLAHIRSLRMPALLLRYGFQSQDFGADANLAAMTASSLAATERKEQALQIVSAMLDQDASNDDYYTLLLSLDTPNAPAKLDALFARDRFEERPLIWKAELLRRAGNLAQAESVVRQAIAIDPSDGEQGPERRMRAYAVLADIRQARGDQKEAELYRGAVRAVRLSERADQFYAAGLLKRAVDMYQESLGHFVDAYCIQSRLAIRLAEMGRHEEAVVHYRKAYELMPDSFGRVESHCFGCERVFDGQRAQSIAEKVFTDLAAESPNKPQVHYLLGYLREEQERHSEALPLFKMAVTLDPDYLNAWSKIASLADQVNLPPADRDAAALNMIRLDPLSRHSYAQLNQVSDLRALWLALEAAQAQRIPPPESLYPLKASADRLAAKAKEADPDLHLDHREFLVQELEEVRREPGKVIAQTRLVQAAAQLMDHAKNSSMRASF